MVDTPTKSKQEVLDELLDKGMVQVLVDARQKGVEVPPHLIGDLQLRLNLSRRFGLPLVFDDDGIIATLTFQKIPHECKLPWEAIYAIISYVTGEPFLFPEDVPLEVVLEADNTIDKPAGPRPAAVPQPQPAMAIPSEGPKLRVVTEETAKEDRQPEPQPEPQPDPPPPSPSPEPKNRGHLRVVK